MVQPSGMGRAAASEAAMSEKARWFLYGLGFVLIFIGTVTEKQC